MGNVMVGIIFKVRLVCFVRVEINLSVLQDLEWILKATWDLLAHKVEGISCDL